MEEVFEVQSQETSRDQLEGNDNNEEDEDHIMKTESIIQMDQKMNRKNSITKRKTKLFPSTDRYQLSDHNKDRIKSR